MPEILEVEDARRGARTRRPRTRNREGARARSVVPQAGDDAVRTAPRAERQRVHRRTAAREADHPRHQGSRRAPRRAPRDERPGSCRRRRGRRPAHLREQPALPAWHRFGVASPTAARSCCAILAASARSSSIPTRRASAPTPSRSRSRNSTARSTPQPRADQGRAHGPVAHRRARQPARRRDPVAGGHRSGAARPTARARRSQAAAQGRAPDLANVATARRFAHRRYAARRRHSVPARRCTAPTEDDRRPYDLLLPRTPGLTSDEFLTREQWMTSRS